MGNSSNKLSHFPAEEWCIRILCESSTAPEKESGPYHESRCYSPPSACGAVEVSRKLNRQQTGWNSCCLNWPADEKVQENEKDMSEY